MPKIRTVSKFLDNGSTKTEFTYEIHYNTTEGFFGKMPESFNETVSLMRNEEVSAFFADIKTEHKHNRGSAIKFVMVKGSTESEAIDRTEGLIKHLLSTLVVRRAVILVFYKGGTRSYQNNHEKPFEPFELEFKFKYTTEVSVNGLSPKYVDFSMFKSPFAPYEESEHRNELHLRSNEYIVIDDTQENRDMLESTHGLFVQLNEKLTKFLTNPDELIKLISSNQKLLS